MSGEAASLHGDFWGIKKPAIAGIKTLYLLNSILGGRRQAPRLRNYDCPPRQFQLPRLSSTTFLSLSGVFPAEVVLIFKGTTEVYTPIAFMSIGL